jgi:hypothetical protein
MSIPPFLTLISEVLPVQRRDFYVTDPTLLNPNNANPLIDGEWLELDSNYKLVRGASGEGTNPAWQMFAERGRYDTQAIGKVPVLFMGGYEAETQVATLTSLVVGSPLEVTDVTFQSLTRRGLALSATSSGEHLIFGYVTRVFSDRVRYWYPGTPVWKHHA